MLGAYPPPPVTYSDSENSLFTPGDIQRLMRIEYERAVRYEIPFCLMLIDVDRLGYLQDLYGFQSKEEILQGMGELLRTSTRNADPVGCRLDDRVLVVFPHTTQGGAQAVAARLLEGARRLEFESDGRYLRVTLSIGLAIAERGSRLDFDHFLLAAEEAVAEAISQGGDRFLEVHPLAPEPEEPELPMPPTGAPPVSEEAPTVTAPLPVARIDHEESAGEEPFEVPTELSIEDLGDGPLAEQIRTLFRRLGPERSEAIDEIERQVIQVTEASLASAQAEAFSGEEERRQVDILERRVAKLKEMLGSTEEELQRLLREKTVDPGIKSIYSSVQGLSSESESHARKKDILGLIYEANVRLLEKLRSDS